MIFDTKVPDSLANLPGRRHELSDEEPAKPGEPVKKRQRNKRYATEEERRAARLWTYKLANLRRKGR